jgi:hypothetical protein
MSWFSRRRVEVGAGPILRVDRLNVYYGRAHAVQDVSFTLDRGILAVVGRNGMGKTTVCPTLSPGWWRASGGIKLAGTELVGLPPRNRAGHRLCARRAAALAVAHRRRAPSAGGDAAPIAAAWTIERVARLFRAWPSAAAMAASSSPAASGRCWRSAVALLFNPRLLVMDGAAPRAGACDRRAGGATLEVAGRRCAIGPAGRARDLGVAIPMSPTRRGDGQWPHRADRLPASELTADTGLQRRLLGVTTGADAEERATSRSVGTRPAGSNRNARLHDPSLDRRGFAFRKRPRHRRRRRACGPRIDTLECRRHRYRTA